jgi:pimeloyl-ACP methyl ester carboxylesterase
MNPREAPRGHTSGAGRTFLFLGGDSHPKDAPIGEVLRAGLLRPGDHFLDQQELLDRYNGGAWTPKPALRLAMLERALDDLGGPPERIVLLGRSSGARAATLLAADGALWHRAGALVCLGYPFRHPNRPVERRRFLHLFRVGLPTLLFQGHRDPYGGSRVADEHLLSPAIELEFLDATHNLHLPPPAWEAVMDRIRRFLAENLRSTPGA